MTTEKSRWKDKTKRFDDSVENVLELSTHDIGHHCADILDRVKFGQIFIVARNKTREAVIISVEKYELLNELKIKENAK
jgi:prevent-host-death family protein